VGLGEGGGGGGVFFGFLFCFLWFCLFCFFFFCCCCFWSFCFWFFLKACFVIVTGISALPLVHEVSLKVSHNRQRLVASVGRGLRLLQQHADAHSLAYQVRVGVCGWVCVCGCVCGWVCVERGDTHLRNPHTATSRNASSV